MPISRQHRSSGMDVFLYATENAASDRIELVSFVAGFAGVPPSRAAVRAVPKFKFIHAGTGAKMQVLVAKPRERL